MLQETLERHIAEPVVQVQRAPTRAERQTEPTPQTRGENGVILTDSAIRRRPVSFRFLGTGYAVNTWKDILQNLSEIMYDRNPTDFGRKAPRLRGSSRVYYTRNEGDLDEPRPIGSSGWFVETKFDADNMLTRCQGNPVRMTQNS